MPDQKRIFRMVNTKNQVFILKPTDSFKEKNKAHPYSSVALPFFKRLIFRYNFAWLSVFNFFPFKFSFSIVINKNMSLKGAGSVCFCIHIFYRIREERIMNTRC